jgi:hypothetical protein
MDMAKKYKVKSVTMVLKKAQYELAVVQGKFRKEQMSCKHYNHKPQGGEKWEKGPLE